MHPMQQIHQEVDWSHVTGTDQSAVSQWFDVKLDKQTGDRKRVACRVMMLSREK